MWIKYIFVCDPDECDALVEFTARDGYDFPLGVIQMHCPCGRMLNYISHEKAYEPVFEDVMKVTPREVVKINTNPYTL
jgi:hypothetical protein